MNFALDFKYTEFKRAGDVDYDMFVTFWWVLH